MTKGWLKTDPYVGIRFHKEQVERDFLDKSELKNYSISRSTFPDCRRYGTYSRFVA